MPIYVDWDSYETPMECNAITKFNDLYTYVINCHKYLHVRYLNLSFYHNIQRYPGVIKTPI